MTETGGEETIVEGGGGVTPEGVSLRPGERLGRYTALELLGTGGMGQVFRAYDHVLDRTVALKVLRRADAQERTRLIREARALAKLSHQNVVGVYEVGETDGRVFLAMELVEGTTLRKWLRTPGHTLEDTLEVFRAAAKGLYAAHCAGIVHRDFKPENVLVGEDGRVRVTDFGLALPVGTSRTPSRPSEVPLDERLTESGCVMGTPGYMPIEQHLGMPTDVRSDQFSFCVALYEAVHGRRPFRGRTCRELCKAITARDLRVPPSSRVPWQVHDAIVRGLSARPEQRFESMEALLHALRHPSTHPPARGPLHVVLGAVMGALAMALVQPALALAAPRLLDITEAEPGLSAALEGLQAHAVQHAVTARRASTAIECETAFTRDLGARMLCLDGLPPT